MGRVQKSSTEVITTVSVLLGLVILSFVLTLNSGGKMFFTGHLDEEILGVPWGCSFEELQQILKKYKYPPKLYKTEKGYSLTTYSFKGGPPNLSDNVRRTSFYMFNEYGLCQIGIIFFARNEKLSKNQYQYFRKIIAEEADGSADNEIVMYIDSPTCMGGGSKLERVSFDFNPGWADIDLPSNACAFTACKVL